MREEEPAEKTPEIMYERLIKNAQEILVQNEDRGLIMPDRGYYEGVWLWDTGFIEIGEAHSNPEAASRRLFDWISQAQWKNGFVPHILFLDKKVERYFPGPEYWQIETSSNRPAAETSGITQPPVLAFCSWEVYEKLKTESPDNAKDFLAKMFPRLLAFHQYLIRERDPEQSGLVSIYHPWESGMDNSPRWQEALAKIPVSQKQIIEIRNLRRDVKNLKNQWAKEGKNDTEALEMALSMRPTDEDYARFFFLLNFSKDRQYDDRKIYREIPFNVKDVLFNSIFCASNQSLLEIARELKIENSEVAQIEKYLEKQKIALEKLYDPETNLYYDFDVKNQRLIKRKTIAGFMPLITGMVPKERAERMAKIGQSEDFSLNKGKFLIASTAKSDPNFHSQSYWRGPIWMPTNWLVAKGLEISGLKPESEQIKKSLLELVTEKGFYEYFDAQTLTGLGRADFSWTAALTIDILKQ